MKTKRTFIMFLATVMCCMLGLFSLSVQVFADGESADSWTKNANETVTLSSVGAGKYVHTNSPECFYLTGEEISGNYVVETTFTGSSSIQGTAGDRYDIGFLAYYYDQNNWVSFSASWWNGFAGGKVVDMLAIVCDNGALAYNDHFFDNPAFNTAAVYQKTDTDSVTLKVKKEYNGAAGMDNYTFYAEGEELFSLNVALSVRYTAPSKIGYVGNCVNEATFTYSPVSIYEQGPSGDYYGFRTYEGANGKVTGEIVFEDGKYIANATTAATENFVILNNDFVAKNYSVTANAELTLFEEGAEIILSGWYNGAKDNAMVSLSKKEGKTVLALNVVAGGKNILHKEKEVSLSSVAELSVEKIGTTLYVKFGGEEIFDYTSSAFANGTSAVMGAGNCNAKIAVDIAEKPYNAYDFYKVTVSGTTYEVSAKDMTSVTFGEGTIAISAEEAKETVVLFPSNASGQMTYTASFAGTAAAYGIYGYYADAENYILVYAKENKIYLKGVFAGNETVESATVEAMPSSLTFSVEGQTVKVLSGETVIFDNKTFEGINDVATFNIGLTAQNGDVIVSDIVVDKFVPYTQRIVGDYVLYGDSYSTWKVEEGKLLANCENGTAWMRTLAFRSLGDYTPATGYYAAATVKVTGKEKGQTEWKAGFLPYYVDNGNYVYMWLSQWAGQGTSIVMHAVLNGQTSGEVFRETAVTCNLEDLNYVETRITGNTVSVYLNKSFAPTATVNFDGLGEKADKGYFGFNVFHVSAEYADVAFSSERIFKDETKPVIDVIGTLPEEVELGKQVTLPVFASEGANVTVEVKFGETIIEVIKNKFTPDKEGIYTVTAKAVNEWGMETVETLSITVKAAQSEQPQPSDKKEGCMASAGVCGLGLAVAFAACVIRRKRSA